MRPINRPTPPTSAACSLLDTVSRIVGCKRSIHIRNLCTFALPSTATLLSSTFQYLHSFIYKVLQTASRPFAISSSPPLPPPSRPGHDAAPASDASNVPRRPAQHRATTAAAALPIAKSVAVPLSAAPLPLLRFSHSLPPQRIRPRSHLDIRRPHTLFPPPD